MDEKMKKLLDAIFEKLTVDQREKAKQCKTFDELMELAGKEGFELPDECLDVVSGGFKIDWHSVDIVEPASRPGKSDKPITPPPVDTEIFFC